MHTEFKNGSVAQLDRAPDYGSGGLRFESLQNHKGLNVNKLEVMSKVCELTGKRPITGNKVSHSNRKTKRRFLPNLQTKRLYDEELGEWVVVKVSTSALRSISKHGLMGYVKKLEKKGR